MTSLVSSNWAWATYMNMASNSTFVTYGEPLPPPGAFMIVR